DLITLVATVFYAASVVLVGMVVGAYGPIAVAATAATLGGLTTLPFTAVALGATEWGAISTVSWIAIIYSIFGAFVLAQIFWFKSISQIGSTQTIIYNYLQPVFGVLLAALILGERLDLTQI